MLQRRTYESIYLVVFLGSAVALHALINREPKSTEIKALIGPFAAALLFCGAKVIQLAIRRQLEMKRTIALRPVQFEAQTPAMRDYSSQWREYRKILWGAYTLIPLYFLVILVSNSLNLHPAISLPPIIVWNVYLWTKLKNWKCPRCGSTRHGLFRSPLFVKKCRNCGLPKYSNG